MAEEEKESDSIQSAGKKGGIVIGDYRITLKNTEGWQSVINGLRRQGKTHAGRKK